MSMHLTLPSDVEAMVEKHLATGEFTTPEDVLRRALQALDDKEHWTEADREDVDQKIDRALSQVAERKVYSPEEALGELARKRASHLAARGQ